MWYRIISIRKKLFFEKVLKINSILHVPFIRPMHFLIIFFCHFSIMFSYKIFAVFRKIYKKRWKLLQKIRVSGNSMSLTDKHLVKASALDIFFHTVFLKCSFRAYKRKMDSATITILCASDIFHSHLKCDWPCVYTFQMPWNLQGFGW